MKKAKSNVSLSPKKKVEAKERPEQTSDSDNASHVHELHRDGLFKAPAPKNSQSQVSPIASKQTPTKKPSGLLKPTASSLSRASFGKAVKNSPVRPQVATLRNRPTSSREPLSPDKTTPKKAAIAIPPPRTSSLAPAAGVLTTEADAEPKPDEVDSKGAEELALAQEHELVELRSTIESLKADIERLKEAKEHDDNLNEQRLKTLDHQLQESQQANRQDIESRDHDLETLRLTLKRNHKEKDAEVGELRQTIQDLEKRIKDESDEKRDLHRMVEAMQDQVQDTYTKKQREVDATRAALAQEHRDAISDYEAVISKLRSECEFLSLNPRPGQATSLTKEPKEPGHDIEDNEASLTRTLKAGNEELRATLAEMHSSNVELRHKLEDKTNYEKTIEELKQELGMSISERDELKKSAHQYEEVIKVYQDQVDVNEAARSYNKEALAQASGNSSDQQLDTKKTLESNDELKVQLQLAQEEMEHQAKRVRKLESNLAEATAKVLEGRSKPGDAPTGSNGELMAGIKNLLYQINDMNESSMRESKKAIMRAESISSLGLSSAFKDLLKEKGQRDYPDKDPKPLFVLPDPPDDGVYLSSTDEAAPPVRESPADRNSALCSLLTERPAPSSPLLSLLSED